MHVAASLPRTLPEPARLYQLELERVRLRAMLAVERLEPHADDTLARRLAGELATVEGRLAPLRPTGRAALLGERLGLDDDELDLLWTAVALAADPRVLPPAQVLGGREARRGATLALHALIADLDGERARALAARLVHAHRLLREHLLVWSDADSAPAARPLIVPPRVIAWLAGHDALDEALAGAAQVVELPRDMAPDAGQLAVVGRLADLLAAEPAPLICVEGPHGAGRRTAVAAAAVGLGRAVVALAGTHKVEALAALRRECALRGAIPLVADAEGAEVFREVGRVFADVTGPVVVTTAHAGVDVPTERVLVRVAIGAPSLETRRALWQRALGADAPRVRDVVEQLALRHALGPGGIRRAAQAARLGAGRRPLEGADLAGGVQGTVAERFGDLASRREIKQTWDDLVLDEDLLAQVHALIARVRHSGRVLGEWGFAGKLPGGPGVAALLSGPPGTGKTMVAGLIARELGLEVYQVDLSRVTSKWIGETEKHLAQVFAAAEAGHALLLFDEADALFARRTEVNTSNDRHANLGVNYLLQRIEAFGGVTVLTTNHERQLDPALRRRLAAHIVFAAPDVEERERLWRRMLGTGAPIEGELDMRRLATAFPDMTGANIKNAVVAAAFLAAAAESGISQARLERAARAEYASMGRVLTTT